MSGESDQGLNKLAQVMQQRINRNQEVNSALLLDFGTIQGDMSLKTNTFAIPIPQADYHVCRQVTLGPTGSLLTKTKTQGQHGGHIGGDGSHDHDIKVPEKMRSIMPGDRVLVAWVQSEAVIIDIVLRGTEV